MPVRGILFDMGGTLLHYSPPDTDWEGTEKIGAMGVYRLLADRGCALPPEADALDMAWDHARQLWLSLQNNYDVKALKLDLQLRNVAALWGVDPLPDALRDALAPAYMAAIQATVRPLDGATDVLRTLRNQGLRVGLISNTVWPGSAHVDDLTRYGLLPYLEHLIFSADAEAWKPDSDIFNRGLSALDLKPEEAIYVGDSLFFDVHGAQGAGMRGVWIEQPHHWVPDGMVIVPDATIKTLPDLITLVAKWGAS